MDHVERLIAQWRHGAIVAGQFSIEGEDGTDQQLAAGQAMALCECADELEALLAERPQPQEASVPMEVLRDWFGYCEDIKGFLEDRDLASLASSLFALKAEIENSLFRAKSEPLRSPKP